MEYCQYIQTYIAVNSKGDMKNVRSEERRYLYDVNIIVF